MENETREKKLKFVEAQKKKSLKMFASDKPDRIFIRLIKITNLLINLNHFSACSSV